MGPKVWAGQIGMPGTQVDIQFAAAVQAAIARPEQANLDELWQALQQVLADQPDDVQLKLAGEAIAQFADVLSAKAEAWIAAWEAAHNPPDTTEPILTAEMLASFLRQSMSLNLEGLVENFSRTLHSPEEGVKSLIGTVEKELLLAMVDALEAKEEALAIAHAEDVSQWVTTIARYLKENSRKQVSLSELQQSLSLSFVEIWLGLLLGGFQLQSGWNRKTTSLDSFADSFYQSELYVRVS
ncbi:hypothetical protein [Leptodesmis sp.]|uniref:hypothetical protein n=1 Tax=Leptodesmis sp. TaxID=3100501 RepID=UPI0040535840